MLYGYAVRSLMNLMDSVVCKTKEQIVRVNQSDKGSAHQKHVSGSWVKARDWHIVSSESEHVSQALTYSIWIGLGPDWLFVCNQCILDTRDSCIS